MQSLEIKNLLKPVTRNWLSNKSLRAKKSIYQLFKNREVGEEKIILFVIGCQRSGTTLMLDIFERDFDAKVYGEFTKMSSQDVAHKIRLNPLPVVKAEIDKDKVPLVVLKPLVESQNALKLLDYFHNAKALWMYRDHGDVALSCVRKWGSETARSNLRAIVQNAAQNWRSEKVSEETGRIVRNYFSEDMNPYDAAALFWLTRNRLFFELNLDKHPNVTLCQYEDLVENPIRVMRNIHCFIGRQYPSDSIFSDVHSESKGQGKCVQLSPEVDLLCSELLEKLNTLYAARGSV